MPILFSGWDTPLNLLKAEVTQLEYEGRPVPGRLKERINNLPVTNDPWPTPEMEILAEELERLEMDKKFPFVQPNDLAAILEQAPLPQSRRSKTLRPQNSLTACTAPGPAGPLAAPWGSRWKSWACSATAP